MGLHRADVAGEVDVLARGVARPRPRSRGGSRGGVALRGGGVFSARLFRDAGARHSSAASNRLARRLARRGSLGRAFGDDIARAAEGVVDGGDVAGEESRASERAGTARVATSGIQDGVRERFEAARDRDGGAGRAFGSVREVEILECGEGVGGANRALERRVQRSGLVERREDGVTARLEAVEVGEARGDVAERVLVHAARGLLAVARDEGNCALVIQERHRRANVAFGEAGRARDGSDGSSTSTGRGRGRGARRAARRAFTPLRGGNGIAGDPAARHDDARTTVTAT